MSGPRYRLQHRYQDSNWMPLDVTYDDLVPAARAAKELSREAIIYGMVRVWDRQERRPAVTYPAGGGPPVDQPTAPMADPAVARPRVRPHCGDDAYAGPGPLAASPAAEDVVARKFPPGLEGWLLRLADML